MVILFGLALAGCLVLLLLHASSSRAPRRADAFGGVKPLQSLDSDPKRTVAQVERAEIERVGGPLRAAMDGAGEVEIGGCRFKRTAPGEYRYDGWTAKAVLTLQPIANGRVFQVAYAVDARW